MTVLRLCPDGLKVTLVRHMFLVPDKHGSIRCKVLNKDDQVQGETVKIYNNTGSGNQKKQRFGQFRPYCVDDVSLTSVMLSVKCLSSLDGVRFVSASDRCLVVWALFVFDRCRFGCARRAAAVIRPPFSPIHLV